MQVSEKKNPHGIYLLALDHKLLNLKNTIDIKTELCIHLHLFSQHIFTKRRLCSRHSLFPHKSENVKQEASTWERIAALSQRQPFLGPVGQEFILHAVELGGPLGNIVPLMHSRTGKASCWHLLPSSLKEGFLQRWGLREEVPALEWNVSHPRKEGEPLMSRSRRQPCIPGKFL